MTSKEWSRDQKILGWLILHYGRPYLKTAVAALADQVDHIIILYTPNPSQGWPSQMPCPDSEADLKAEVAAFEDKITWVDGSWANEGEHTDAIREFEGAYDWRVRFDSDEVYPPGTVAEWIRQAELTNAQDFRAPFLHFWRSFGKVCRDSQNPQRLWRVNGGDSFAYLDGGDKEQYRVLHFGYAQPDVYIQYKMQVQGHHAEWRPQWYHDKWSANAQTDVHPVILNFWNTEPFDKTLLPPLLHDHPYYQLDFIA